MCCSVALSAFSLLQPSPPSTRRTFSSSQTDTLSLSNADSPFFFLYFWIWTSCLHILVRQAREGRTGQWAGRSMRKRKQEVSAKKRSQEVHPGSCSPVWEGWVRPIPPKAGSHYPRSKQGPGVAKMLSWPKLNLPSFRFSAVKWGRNPCRNSAHYETQPSNINHFHDVLN